MKVGTTPHTELKAFTDYLISLKKFSDVKDMYKNFELVDSSKGYRILVNKETGQPSYGIKINKN